MTMYSFFFEWVHVQRGGVVGSMNYIVAKTRKEKQAPS